MASGHHGELDAFTPWYWLADDVQVLWGTIMYVALLSHDSSATLIPILGWRWGSLKRNTL